MSGFAASVSAEMRKVFSTRLWWVLAIILVVYVGGLAAGFAAVVGVGTSEASLQLPVVAPYVYSLASAIGYVVPVLFGALSVTTEFRNNSLTPTFQAQPRRGLVLGAKLVTGLLLGAVYGVIGAAATVGLGAPLLTVYDLPTELGQSDTWAMIGRLVLAMALWAALGVALGVLVPSQVGAIVIVLAFTQFIEPILRLAASIAEWTAEVGRFLPGAASDALVGSSIFTAISGSAAEQLEWWQGGLVLAGYAVVFAVLGGMLTWRRDVT